MKRIVTDHENHGEAFWTHLTSDVIHMAHISPEAQQAAAELCEPGCDAVEVSDEMAAELLAWFRTLPGWHDGPDYAPHPVLCQAVEE